MGGLILLWGQKQEEAWAVLGAVGEDASGFQCVLLLGLDFFFFF